MHYISLERQDNKKKGRGKEKRDRHKTRELGGPNYFASYGCYGTKKDMSLCILLVHVYY